MAKITVAEWAKREGISRTAAYKRIENGKVQCVDGKVDTEQAAVDWKRNQDTLQVQRGAHSCKPKRAAGANSVAAEATEPDEKQSLSESQRQEAILRIEERRLKLKLARATVVDAVEVERATMERAQAERDALLNWPAQIAPDMAVTLGVDERLLHSALDASLRKFLESRGEFTLASDPVKA